MPNIIAVIWDFDKTLVDGYMQDPIFEEYGVDAADFWREANALPGMYLKTQGVKVNPDTIYLNHFIHRTREGLFPGLNNKKLREFGASLKFYPGVPEIFSVINELLTNERKYGDYDIKVEQYIVSTGMAEVIKGSSIMPYVENIWGCELIEETGADGVPVIAEVGYTIDNTTKTRALFEINKGVWNSGGLIEVNTNIPEDRRRVSFKNMIYIADGPSDVPAFSVVNRNGGATFAIYPRGNMKAFAQAEQLRKDGRINMFAEADYRKDTTAYMWITAKIREMADRIYGEEKQKIIKNISELPRHLA